MLHKFKQTDQVQQWTKIIFLNQLIKKWSMDDGFGYVCLFNGISTFMGYLMPKPSL